MTLRDWNPFARRGPTEVGTPPDLAAALTDLDRFAAPRPELAPAADALGAVLRAAFVPPPPVPPVHAGPDLIAAAWRVGVPAFRAGKAPPALDPDDLRARALAVIGARPPGAPRAGPVRDAIRAGRLDPAAWAADVLSGQAEAIDTRAESLGLDPATARAVLRMALLPPLEGLSKGLDALRPEGAWTRGDCPNCGAPPVLGESRGLEQRRFWRCGVCAASWGGDRLRCPFCDETDHRRLSYRFVEGEADRHRLAVCESCGGRLKVVATLAPLSAPGLLVAELAAAHLDLADEGGA